MRTKPRLKRNPSPRSVAAPSLWPGGCWVRDFCRRHVAAAVAPLPARRNLQLSRRRDPRRRRPLSRPLAPHAARILGAARSLSRPRPSFPVGKVLRPERQRHALCRRRVRPLLAGPPAQPAAAAERALQPRLDGAARHLSLSPHLPRRQGRPLRRLQAVLADLPRRVDDPGLLGEPHPAPRPAAQHARRRGTGWPARRRRPRSLARVLPPRGGRRQPKVHLSLRPRQQGALHHDRRLGAQPPPKLLRRDWDVDRASAGGHVRLPQHRRRAAPRRLGLAALHRLPAAAGIRCANGGPRRREEVGLRPSLPPLCGQHKLPPARPACSAGEGRVAVRARVTAHRASVTAERSHLETRRSTLYTRDW